VVSPAIALALKAGAHHRGTEDTENGSGQTAHASLNRFLTQRRKDAKGERGTGWVSFVVHPEPVAALKAGFTAEGAEGAEEGGKQGEGCREW